MPNELYTRWADTLTNYQPTSGRLTLATESGWAYCCLGVACEVSQLGRWINEHYTTNGQKDDAVLPTVVRDALQLQTCHGWFDYTELSTVLTDRLNIALSESHHMEAALGDAPTVADIDSIAQLNDMLAVHPNIFAIIQAVLLDPPPSLFKTQTTTSLPDDTLIALLEETLIE